MNLKALYLFIATVHA